MKLLFAEPLKTALFRTTTKQSTTSDKSVEAFQCSFQFRAMQPSCPKGTNSPPLPTPGAILFWLNSPITVNNIAKGEGGNGQGKCKN